ncbi:TIGR02391 family protein [Pseudomonas sp. B21-015]|uniref:TIGR02391 family protein n=1 Tax=unclassified Pseudomonas TaxID=196821 RepID=UPI0038D4F4F2
MASVAGLQGLSCVLLPCRLKGHKGCRGADPPVIGLKRPGETRHFGGQQPTLALGPLHRRVRKEEQRGLANLLIGMFGAVRNPPRKQRG